MKIVHGSDPVRWWMVDRWCEPVGLGNLPSRVEGVWEARYDNDCEHGKRTTRTPPTLYGEVLRRLQTDQVRQEWSERLGYDLVHDETVHGGGLHVTDPGGWLNTHLDYDRHPGKPAFRRAINFIAFLNPEWSTSWGGNLQLCDPLGKAVTVIRPQPGRLFAFEVGDLAYHGVSKVTGDVPRVTIACYLLSACKGHESRLRALFMPTRGTS